MGVTSLQLFTLWDDDGTYFWEGFTSSLKIVMDVIWILKFSLSLSHLALSLLLYVVPKQKWRWSLRYWISEEFNTSICRESFIIYLFCVCVNTVYQFRPLDASICGQFFGRRVCSHVLFSSFCFWFWFAKLVQGLSQLWNSEDRSTSKYHLAFKKSFRCRYFCNLCTSFECKGLFF